MAAMNVVHMRVKPGMESALLQVHREMTLAAMPGGRKLSVIQSGGRSFIIVAEWDSLEALASARPAMIANLDKLRPLLEDLGGGRGVTEPWSGEIVMSVG